MNWKKIVYFSVFLIASLLAFLYYWYSSEPVMLILTGIFSGYFGLSLLIEYGSRSNEDEVRSLQIIREERKDITTSLAKDEIDIYTTIKLSLNQLQEYYTINKGQARRSFQFSLGAIVVGLVTIVIGIALFYSNKTNLTTTIIASISGVLLEFIGGAYFFLYKKSLDQVNLFFGQLIKVQDTMLAINMANEIGNNERKMIVQEKIITSLLERSLK